MAKFDLRAYARAGAEARVVEIKTELAQIERALPGLSKGSRVAIGIAPVRPRGRRKPMSAAQKRAVGLRMKKYWDRWRKEHGKA